MWRAAVLIAFFTACGRVGFDGVGPPANLVQTGNNNHNAPAVTVPIAPSMASTLIVVATASFNAGAPVDAVTDDASDTFVSADALSTWHDPTLHDVEIWYSVSGHGGATQIVVSSSVSGVRQAWGARALRRGSRRSADRRHG